MISTIFPTSQSPARRRSSNWQQRILTPRKSESEKNYWKWNFFLTLFPLSFCGIPVYLLAFRKGQHRHIQTSRQWISFIISACTDQKIGFVLILIPINVIFIVVLLGVNWIFGSSLYNVLFHSLLIQGQIELKDVFTSFNMVRLILLVLSLNYVWARGYIIRNLIKGLLKESNSLLQEEPPQFHGSYRLRLVLLYLLIAFIHSVHFYFYAERIDNGIADAVVRTISRYFASPVLVTLLFPPYVNAGWMIQRQFQILGHVLQTRGYSDAVDIMDTMREAKTFLTKLYNAIQVFNALFSVYMSWAIIVLILSTTIEITDSLLATPSSTPSIRYIVGFLCAIAGKLGLLIYTQCQLGNTNDEARFLLVILNDFAMNTDTPKETGTYNAVRIYLLFSRPWKVALCYGISVVSVSQAINWKLLINCFLVSRVKVLYGIQTASWMP